MPKGWVETELGFILSRITNGSNLKQSDSPFSGTYPVSRIETIWDEKIDLSRVKYVAPSSNEIEKYRLLHGDILFSHINSDKHLGKTAIFNLEIDMIHGINLLLLRTFPQYDGFLLNYLLRYYRYSGRFIKVAQRAVNQSSINQKKLKEFSIPIPPLPEQQRIVAKIDSLFARLEEVKERLAKVPTLLKNFRQAILTQAVTGKLTEEWRDRVKSESEELGEWVEQSAKECCAKVQSGGTPKGGAFSSDGIPFFKVYNIVDQRISFSYRPQYISEEIQHSQCKKSICYPNDVLMNIVGPPLNKVAIVPDQFKECNINQAITLFRPKEYLDHKFLYYFLREGSSVNKLVNETRGVVGQVNISLTQCREFRISIPPLKEQTEIVNRVESLFAKADAIEARYAALKAQVEQLPQAILAKAFRGELVEQLPTDGDAKDLLREIAELRAKASPKRQASV